MKNVCSRLLFIFFAVTASLQLNAQNWQIVWQDEFNYTGLPDPNKWGYDVGAGGWGNGEAQYYSNARLENSRVENGNLILEARRDWAGAEYSSARLVSRNKGDWTYGRIEIRAKIPVGQGLWPAIWMLPTDWAYGGWPASGEIDIMESFALGGLKYDKVEANIHTQAYNHTIGTNKGAAITGLSNIEQNYHTYRVTWYANRMVFDVDGQEYFTFNNEGSWQTWPYDKRFHMILNIAVGGALGTWIDPNIFPKRMEVDYVRVYQDSPGPAPSTDVVTSWADCNYTGFSGGLPVGTYTLAQLNALGIADNSISSMSLLEGYQAILYENDNFGGASMTLTASNNCVGGFNDRTSSVVIKTNGATNMAGTYFIQNRNSGLYMDQWGAVTTDGGNVAQANYNGNLNQQWQLVHLGDGSYQVIAKHSNKMLDIAAISKANGANAQQWTYFGSFNQQFIMVPVAGGYYKLIAKHSGKMVEVAGAGMNSGDNVQQWDNNGQTCGQWKFKPYTTPGTGNGLTCNYFNGMNFETPVFNRVDATVNFDWGNGTPDAAVNANQFSARWTGQIQPLYTQTYTFHMNSDNGRRLWVNNVLVIDEWLDNWGTEYTGTIALTAGQRYDIRVDYFENAGGANCKLEWSSFFQDRQVVPQTQLYANTLPTVSITAPANNALFVAPATIPIAVTAADAGGSVAKIDFYNGITLIGTDNTAPYTFNWTGVASGTYTLKALATDNRGGVTFSAPITVIVNNAPTVAILTPANNATYVAQATVNFTATAADSDGSVSKVEYFNGATLIGTATAAPYTFSWTNVGAGTYTITAKATDNRGTVTTSAAITVLVNPNQLPTIVITSPVNNATFTAPATVAIAATATDADGTIQKVDFYNGATLIGTDNTAPYTFSWTGVAAGTYVLTAKATDDKTGVKTSTAVTIVVSNPNQLPTVVITSPVNNATFTAPATVAIAATATDADGTIQKVDFYNGATLIGTDNTAPYTFSWIGVAAGTYNLTAVATDNQSGVKTSTIVTIVVSNPNQLPTVVITSPVNNATFTAPATVAIAATATDADGTIQKVDFYNGATLIGTDNTAPYTFSWIGVAAGTYNLTAVATDNQSGVKTSTIVTIVVSNPNQLPTVVITSPVNNATFTAPATVAIAATATDADGTIQKVDFYNGTTLIGTSTTAPYSFTWTGVPTGTYSLSAQATDNQSGVATSAFVTIVVNDPNQLPSIAITSPTASSIFTAPASVAITTSATDADGTISQVDFYEGTTLIGTSTAAPYSFTWTNVPQGTYTLTAVATDDENGIMTSASVTITVSPTTGVQSSLAEGIAVYPNPASNLVFVSSQTDLSGATVKVIDMVGREVISETAYKAELDIAGLDAGVYTLIIMKDENLIIKKLVKN